MNGTDLQFLKAALHIPPMFYVLQKRPSIYFSFSTILITMMINIIFYWYFCCNKHRGLYGGVRLNDHVGELRNKWIRCGPRFEGGCKFADIFVNFNSYGSVKYVSGDLNKSNNCNKTKKCCIFSVSHVHFLC